MEYENELKNRIIEIKTKLRNDEIKTDNREELQEELQALIVDYNELQEPQKVTVEDTNRIPYAVFDGEDINKYY